MEPNKVSTMFHYKTNRITLVLAYAFLEWVLIFLLLLNSLFSYLIIKFAHYFGLQQPCLLCSRLDHIIEPQNPNSSYTKLICEHHAIELSTSSYCFTHHKLVESQHMCENCSFSHLHNHKHPSVVSVFKWLKEVGMVKSDDDCLVVENDDGLDLRCSCCGVSIDRYILSPAKMANRDELLYPSDCDEEDDQIGLDSDLINGDDNSDGFSFWLPKRGYSMVDYDQEEDYSYVGERVLPHDVEFYIDLDDYQLVPVKMVDLGTKKHEHESQDDGEEDQKHDQVKDEMDTRDVGDVYHVEKDEPEDGKLATKHNQDRELKREYVVEMELKETRIKEVLRTKGEEEEIKIDVQLGVFDVQVTNGDIPRSENDEAKAENIPTKIGDELKIMELDTNKGHEEEKRVVDDVKSIDTNKQFQVFGDQVHDILITSFDDQVNKETELNQVKSNIVPSNFEDQCNTENGEIDRVNSLDLTHKNEMVEPSITNATKVQVSTSSRTIGDHKEIKIDVQLNVCDVQVPEATEMTDSHVPESENGEAKVEYMATKLGDGLEIKELDNTKAKELLKENGHGDKMVVVDVELIDTNKQLQVSGHQAHEVLITAFDDQVMEESSDLCNAKNNGITTLKSLELAERQMVKPSTPYKEACPFTTVITFQASTSSTIALLENGDCELKQTEKSPEQNYIKVEIEEQEFLYDSALKKSTANELADVVEELKSELKSEQNALHALYIELEEERNAAAVAANHTMLMITRLQEEKATIEMEALQYQRLMEEQSEFDQEALQLMNEILVKREKELEICQKKISEYEGRDGILLLKSTSCTKGNEDSICRCDQNGNIEDSMGSFEEERLSILEQLKVLEEKLCTLSEEEHFNGDSNGIEHYENGRMNGQKPKQLLPLFDATEESDDGLDSVLMAPKSSPTESELECGRVEIEEEVDHLYDRLHALEADKEFIKHCIGSLRKGDRGVHLLQEILQHLRDLKSVELQSRNLYGLC